MIRYLLAVMVVLLLVGCTLLLHLYNKKWNQRQERLLHLEKYKPDGERTVSRKKLTLNDLVHDVGYYIAQLNVIPKKTIDEMFQSLSSSGASQYRNFYIFIGAKIMLLAGGVVLGIYFFLELGDGFLTHLVLPVAMPVVGLLAPDYVLNSMHKKYLKEVDAGMADALDLLTICVDAGMPIEAAIQRVGKDMEAINKSAANELNLTSRDMSVLPDRYGVFRQMARRTGLAVMNQLATVLIQSFEVGAPLAQALRTLSEDVKNDTMLRYQSRVAQLSVYLTLPMVLFILPVIFIVVIGPALIALKLR